MSAQSIAIDNKDLRTQAIAAGRKYEKERADKEREREVMGERRAGTGEVSRTPGATPMKRPIGGVQGLATPMPA
jgi:hypothetical protein